MRLDETIYGVAARSDAAAGHGGKVSSWKMIALPHRIGFWRPDYGGSGRAVRRYIFGRNDLDRARNNARRTAGEFAAVGLSANIARARISHRATEDRNTPAPRRTHPSISRNCPWCRATNQLQFFSFLDDRPVREQVPCHQTRTTERTHELIRQNLHESPMYSGMIHGRGPRYCPSIEDKIVRFADKDSHSLVFWSRKVRDYLRDLLARLFYQSACFCAARNCAFSSGIGKCHHGSSGLCGRVRLPSRRAVQPLSHGQQTSLVSSLLDRCWERAVTKRLVLKASSLVSTPLAT